MIMRNGTNSSLGSLLNLLLLTAVMVMNQPVPASEGMYFFRP